MAYIADCIAGVDVIHHDAHDRYEYDIADVEVVHIAMTWGQFREYLHNNSSSTAILQTPHGFMEIWDIQLVTTNFYDATTIAIGAPTATPKNFRVDPRSVLSDADPNARCSPKDTARLATYLDALFATTAYPEDLGDRLRNTTMSIRYKAAQDTDTDPALWW